MLHDDSPQAPCACTVARGFAGQVGAMAGTHFRLDQDASVDNMAVTRQYFKNLGGVPMDWMEISIPANLPSLPNN